MKEKDQKNFVRQSLALPVGGDKTCPEETQHRSLPQDDGKGIRTKSIARPQNLGTGDNYLQY